MKNLIPVFIFLLAPLFSNGQAYTPLNLDTSCYWIQKYTYYHGAGPIVHVTGEVIQHVEKDTMIGPYKFHKIKGHCTQPIILSGSITNLSYIVAVNQYNCYNPTIYIREDTIAQKIYEFDTGVGLEHLKLNYDLNIGDSISFYRSDTTYYPSLFVDSIRIENHYGISSRTFYGSGWPQTSYNYQRIEGIGASYNFPDVGGGEWSVPMFALAVFVKNGSILYKKDFFPVDSCYRKPKTFFCWPTAVSDEDKLPKAIRYSNNIVRIENINDGHAVRLISMHGAVLFEDKLIGNYQRDLSNLPAGIYILSVQSSKGIENRKIFIR